MKTPRHLMGLLALLLTIIVGTNHAAAQADDADARLTGGVTDPERTLRGTVDSRSHAQIATWLKANPDRELTLHLDSDGGLAAYGEMDYRLLAAHGRVTTDVRPGRLCLSACAYLWMAGATRTIGPTAGVGFHSAYCRDACSATAVAATNQRIMTILTRVEPTLAELVAQTGAMTAGSRRVAVGVKVGGRWRVVTFDTPAAIAGR